MTKTLIVFISEHWPDQPTAPWVLIDQHERVLESGQSNPLHWPAADDCEWVLSGPQCAWLSTHLPDFPRRDQIRVLRYAFEDQLIGDVDEQHLSIASHVKNGTNHEITALVVSRSRLRNLLVQFDNLKLKPVRAVSALQTGEPASDRWTVAAGPDGSHTLHRPGEPAISLDVDNASNMILHLIANSQSPLPKENKIELRPLPGISSPLASKSETGAAFTLDTGPSHRWWVGRRSAADLLHGEFAPGEGSASLVSAVKWPLLVTISALLVLLVANAAQIAWDTHQLHGIEDRMHRLFETTVPHTPSIAPATQLHRSLEDARARHGLLRESDFLSLLDSFAEIGGNETESAIQRVEYENSILNLHFSTGHSLDISLIQQRFLALGFDSKITNDRQSTLSLSRTISR